MHPFLQVKHGIYARNRKVAVCVVPEAAHVGLGVTSKDREKGNVHVTNTLLR